jgi:hypothetical protein
MTDDAIHDVAKALRRIREHCDAVCEARKEVLPYARRCWRATCAWSRASSRRWSAATRRPA